IPRLRIFSTVAATRRSSRRLSRIAKGRLRPAVRKTSARADSQRWRPLALAQKAPSVNTDPPQVPSPSIAERTIDTATDVSRTIEEATAALKVAVDRLNKAIANAEQPGQPIARLRTVTRQAPLQSLFVAFLLGIVVARRLR